MTQLEKDVHTMLADTPRLIQNITEPSKTMWEIAIRSDASVIRHLKVPNPDLYLLAFDHNPLTIEYLPEEFHSEARCKKAINKRPLILDKLKNTSNEVVEYAISKNVNNIMYVTDPSENIQMTAVKKDPLSIRLINAPTDDVCEVAIRKNIHTFELIKNPSKKLIYLAVELSTKSHSISHILDKVPIKTYEFWKVVATHNPTYIFKLENIITCKNKDDIITIALKGAPEQICMISNPTEEQQLIAVNNSGWSIKTIATPTNKVCVAAVTNSPMALNAINKKFQTNEVCLAAVTKNPKAIKYIRLPKEQWSSELIYEVTVSTI